MTQHWFIGFDEREKPAFDVCAYSLLRHASCDVVIHPLKHRQLRHSGLFWREWKLDGAGQWWDIADGKPFSTEFAFTRFLVPHLMRETKVDWAFFVDCDFLFREDVVQLDEYLQPGFAMACVQHNFRPTETAKMDGQIQARYPRKNWSSLMAFNVNHPAHDKLTPEAVSTATGRHLHNFGWLEDLSYIGKLPDRWNRLVGHYDLDLWVSALHYTDGGPWLDDWRGGPMDQEWLDEFANSKHPTPTVLAKGYKRWECLDDTVLWERKAEENMALADEWDRALNGEVDG